MQNKEQGKKCNRKNGKRAVPMEQNIANEAKKKKYK